MYVVIRLAIFEPLNRFFRKINTFLATFFWYKYFKKKDNTDTKDVKENFINIPNINEKNTERIISMIKLLSNKVEIKDKETKLGLKELEDKLNNNVERLMI